jgi:hypothetical protein
LRAQLPDEEHLLSKRGGFVVGVLWVYVGVVENNNEVFLGGKGIIFDRQTGR